MVDFKVRCYHEDSQNNVIGAEVIIYDGDDVVDDILLVDKTKFDELSGKLNTLDNTYVDKDELEGYLQNYAENNVINATLLNGLASDKFLKKADINSYQFNPGSHASNSSTYGAGTIDEYGHVKLVDNLNRENYRAGEALSSHQGYELNQRLTAQENESNITEGGYIHSTFDLKKKNGIAELTIDEWNFASYIGGRYNEWVKSEQLTLPEGFRPATNKKIYLSNMWDFHSRIRINGKYIETWWDGAGHSDNFYGHTTWITE